MFTSLIVFHLLLLVASVGLDKRKGLDRLRNLAIPIGIAFVYIGAIQAPQALLEPAVDLEESDLEAALWVSLLSYFAFLLGHRLNKFRKERAIYVDSLVDVNRIHLGANTFAITALFGYFMVMRQEGGLLAYFGFVPKTGSRFDISGYFYLMPFAIYGAAALWLYLLSLRILPTLQHTFLIVSMVIVTWEAVVTCDRGDTIRAGMLWVGWAYFASQHPSGKGQPQSWRYPALICLASLMGLGVLILPEFRDSGRNILRSDTSFEHALKNSLEGGGASRHSEEHGGEFDSAARIVKRVRNGEINPPGPINIAHWMWNAVPRPLFPNKHEAFEKWAGPNWWKIRFGSSSYHGCSVTGSGESYGMMGWFGLVYWFLLGMAAKWIEGAFRASRTGIIASCIMYLPLVQFVMQDFWAGAMNASIIVVPVLVFLKWAQHPTPEVRKRKKRKQPANASKRREILSQDS